MASFFFSSFRSGGDAKSGGAASTPTPASTLGNKRGSAPARSALAPGPTSRAGDGRAEDTGAGMAGGYDADLSSMTWGSSRDATQEEVRRAVAALSRRKSTSTQSLTAMLAEVTGDGGMPSEPPHQSSQSSSQPHSARSSAVSEDAARFHGAGMHEWGASDGDLLQGVGKSLAASSSEGDLQRMASLFTRSTSSKGSAGSETVGEEAGLATPHSARGVLYESPKGFRAIAARTLGWETPIQPGTNRGTGAGASSNHMNSSSGISAGAAPAQSREEADVGRIAGDRRRVLLKQRSRSKSQDRVAWSAEVSPLLHSNNSRECAAPRKSVDAGEMKVAMRSLMGASAVLAKARARRDQAAQEVADALERTADRTHDASEATEAARRLERLRALVARAVRDAEARAEEVASLQRGVQARGSNLKRANKSLADARGRLQEALRLLRGPSGYGQLSLIESMSERRLAEIGAVLVHVYPVQVFPPAVMESAQQQALQRDLLARVPSRLMAGSAVKTVSSVSTTSRTSLSHVFSSNSFSSNSPTSPTSASAPSSPLFRPRPERHSHPSEECGSMDGEEGSRNGDSDSDVHTDSAAGGAGGSELVAGLGSGSSPRMKLEGMLANHHSKMATCEGLAHSPLRGHHGANGHDSCLRPTHAEGADAGGSLGPSSPRPSVGEEDAAGEPYGGSSSVCDENSVRSEPALGRHSLDGRPELRAGALHHEDGGAGDRARSLMDHADKEAAGAQQRASTSHTSHDLRPVASTSDLRAMQSPGNGVKSRAGPASRASSGAPGPASTLVSSSSTSSGSLSGMASLATAAAAIARSVNSFTGMSSSGGSSGGSPWVSVADLTLHFGWVEWDTNSNVRGAASSLLLAHGAQVLRPTRCAPAGRTPPSFKDKEENDHVSTALGYIAHLVSLFAKYLDVPLRYSLVPAGSRSSVEDYVAAALATPALYPMPPEMAADALTAARFPLHTDGASDRTRFLFALLLLNKSIEQILTTKGMGAVRTSQALLSLPKLYSLVTLD